MKKILVLCFMLMLFAMPLSMVANCEEGINDSFNIPPAEVEPFKFKDDDMVVKYYSGAAVYEFAAGKTIDEIVKSDALTPVYIVVSDGNLDCRYKDSEGGIVTLPISCLARSYYSKMCVYIQNHTEFFDGDVKVEKTYIFSEMWGFSVYFVTDKGDFVMYKPTLTAEEIYLMPEKVYRTCAERMTEYLNIPEDNKCPDYTYFADIGEYLIYPEVLPPITEDEVLPQTTPAPTEDPKVTDTPFGDLPETVPTPEPDNTEPHDTHDAAKPEVEFFTVVICSVLASSVFTLAIVAFVMKLRR